MSTSRFDAFQRASRCSSAGSTTVPPAAEVDWAQCGSLEVGGRLRRLSAPVLTLNCSRMLFPEFTVSEPMEEFLRCRQNAFAFFGGVPRRAFHDNLKTVVLARVGEDVRFNLRFEDFAGHDLFKSVARNPASGWEKGQVERSIQYIRSSFLSGGNFRSLEEINSAAITWRDETANRRIHKTTGKRPIDLFAEERKTGSPSSGSSPSPSRSASGERYPTRERWRMPNGN